MHTRQLLTGIITASATLLLLTGCGTTTQPKPIAIPKMAAYGTGTNTNKTVQAQLGDRALLGTTIIGNIAKSSKNATVQERLYVGLKSQSYDLAANNPYFITGNRTTPTCTIGKNKTSRGYYVAGDTFITPSPTISISANQANTAIKNSITDLIKTKQIRTAAAKANLGEGKYEFTMNHGETIRIKINGDTTTISGIRLTTVIDPKTCYNLDELPSTRPAVIKMWQAAAKKAGEF